MIQLKYTITISDTYKPCYDIEPNVTDCIVCFIFIETQWDVMLMIGDKVVQFTGTTLCVIAALSNMSIYQ